MGNIFDNLNKEWYNKLLPILGRDYFKEMDSFVAAEQQSNTVYPPTDQIFAAFNLTPLSEVKVVIIGQDPYHGEGQAHGLAFSVVDGIKIPASLRNIYKAIVLDLGLDMSAAKGELTSWAEQGVLLLNSVLTVRDGKAASHRSKGWERFTDATLELLARESDDVVYILWGKDAWKREDIINKEGNNLIKECASLTLIFVQRFL